MKKSITFLTIFMGILATSFGSVLTDAIKIRIQGNGSDETVVRFLPGCDDTYNNGYDAQKLFSGASVPSIYTRTSNGTNLAINALAPLATRISVPVYLRTFNSGTYTISSVVLGNFSPGVKIMLQDINTGNYTDIIVSNYSYHVAIPVSTPSSPSFILHFILPPEVVEVNEARCSTGLAGSFVFNRRSSLSAPFSVTDSVGTIVTQGLSSNLTDTIAGLSRGIYKIRVFHDSAAVEVTVAIGNNDHPVASFTASTTFVNTGDQVDFTSSSVNLQASVWSFGDSVTGSGNAVSHAYNQAGAYTVKLKVVNGSCSDSASLRIDVSSLTSVDGYNTNKRYVTTGGNIIECGEGVTQVIVYEVSGKLVSTHVLTSAITPIYLPQEGVYIIYTGTKSIKFIYTNPNNL